VCRCRPRLTLGDTYPRNPDIDIQHYVFALTLSDASDEIAGEATIDVRFVRGDVAEFSLDLIGRSVERENNSDHRGRPGRWRAVPFSAGGAHPAGLRQPQEPAITIVHQGTPPVAS
jgi:hypothetical protein